MALLETLVFLLVVCVVMARAVGEAGLLMTETSFRPVDLVRLVSPMRALGPSTLTALSLADAVFTRDLRGNLLSTFLDALKMSDATRLDRRHLFGALAIALLVALTFGTWLHIALPYEHGGIGMYSYIYRGNPLLGFRFFAPVLQSGDDYDARLPIFFASGVALTLAMSVLRMRYVWWPLSPLGFALSGSWSMIVLVPDTGVMRWRDCAVWWHAHLPAPAAVIFGLAVRRLSGRRSPPLPHAGRAPCGRAISPLPAQ